MNEINAIDNLAALCPNHHWEFDHGKLMPEQIAAGRQVPTESHKLQCGEDRYLSPHPNPITPIKAGERFYDRRTVGETAEVRNVVKPVGPFAIMNPGETRPDQSSRQA